MTAKRVNEIDLLRFLAVTAVVLFHYAFRGYAADGLSSMPYPMLEWSKYGYLGVTLFFMISGFVIFMTAESGSLRSFMVSRVVRLYPAFWACCTLTFLLVVVAGAPRFHATLAQYAVNMTMLSGFFGVPSIDNAYWSLFVEIQFYAMVAVVLMLRQIHRAQLLLVFWLLASIALEIFPIGRLRMLLLTEYAAFFIAGAVLYLVWSQGISPTRIAMLLLSWALGSWQSVKALADMRLHYHAELRADVVVAIISLFFVVLFLVAARRLGRFGELRWVGLGALTYPLYLIHQNLGYIMFNRFYTGANAHWLFWGTIALSVCVAYAVNILVEKRLSRYLKSAIERMLGRAWPRASRV